MKPHPRVRKTVKWAGAVSLVTLSALWIGTARHAVLFVWKSGLTVMSAYGTIGIGKQYVWLPIPPEMQGWHLDMGGSAPLQWWFNGEWDDAARNVSVPLWAVCLPVLIATGAAWRLDVLATRRKKVGRCATCGYDRAGLKLDAACPECGAESSLAG
ncbi:MAG: hypothetical protein KF805_05525 [Phycisphaeraceae bacterium]|nr:hypothetical protein [Phycisphaeraceae bacterium]